MPRPQEFDTDQALGQALDVFRKRGYAACSMADILSATGLSKSSLYATFGSKHELFLRALDRHREERREVARSCLRQRPGRQGIEAYLRHIAEETRLPGRDPCMTVRQALDLAPHDPEVEKRVNADFSALQAAFACVIQRGQNDGSVKASAPAETLARILTVGYLGILVSARAGLAPETSHASLNALLGMLDADCPLDA